MLIIEFEHIPFEWMQNATYYDLFIGAFVDVLVEAGNLTTRNVFIDDLEAAFNETATGSQVPAGTHVEARMEFYDTPTSEDTLRRLYVELSESARQVFRANEFFHDAGTRVLELYASTDVEVPKEPTAWWIWFILAVVIVAFLALAVTLGQQFLKRRQLQAHIDTEEEAFAYQESQQWMQAAKKGVTKARDQSRSLMMMNSFKVGGTATKMRAAGGFSGDDMQIYGNPLRSEAALQEATTGGLARWPTNVKMRDGRQVAETELTPLAEGNEEEEASNEINPASAEANLRSMSVAAAPKGANLLEEGSDDEGDHAAGNDDSENESPLFEPTKSFKQETAAEAAAAEAKVKVSATRSETWSPLGGVGTGAQAPRVAARTTTTTYSPIADTPTRKSPMALAQDLLKPMRKAMDGL